jgi:hypothetical protein
MAKLKTKNEKSINNPTNDITFTITLEILQWLLLHVKKLLVVFMFN